MLIIIIEALMVPVYNKKKDKINHQSYNIFCIFSVKRDTDFFLMSTRHF